MDIIITGGGASGMMAAIVAIKNGAKVTIIEQKNRLGKKLSATGNGKCNLTNLKLRSNPELYYNLSENDMLKVKDIFEKSSVDNILDEFKSLGLVTKTRGELVYPYSDQAESVCFVLESYLKENGCQIITDSLVKDIIRNDKGFIVRTSTGDYEAATVICSMGSKAAPKLSGSDKGYYILSKLGHSVNSVSPGLTKLCAAGKIYKKISGIRINAKISLMREKPCEDALIYSESGELLFTDYGISGVVSMNMSNRWGIEKNGTYLLIDMAENITREQLIDMLRETSVNHNKRTASDILRGLLPDKLCVALCEQLNIKEALADDDIIKLVELIKSFRVDITGCRDYDDAQISLGGIPLAEVSNNLESLLVPGLFITGELLDVHGGCGGYNLQWAFSTGMIAGENAARYGF